MSCVKWQAYIKTRTYNGIMEGNIKAIFRGRQYETKNCSVLHISQATKYIRCPLEAQGSNPDCSVILF